MGRRCALAGVACLSYKPSKNLSLFRFPKDPSKRKQWLDICGLEEAKLQVRSVLCSLHFTENDVCLRGKLYSLKPGAVPKVYSRENVVLIPQRPPPLIPMKKIKVTANPSSVKTTCKQAAKLKSKGKQCLISQRKFLPSKLRSSPPPLTLLDGKEIPPSILESLESVEDRPKVLFHYLSRLSIQPQQNQEALSTSIPKTLLKKQVERLTKDLGSTTDEKIRLQMENARLKAELRDVKKDLRSAIENEARLRSRVEWTLRRCDEKMKENCRIRAQVRRMQMLADVDFEIGKWGKKRIGNVMSVIDVA